jgi:hypothetical protein
MCICAQQEACAIVGGSFRDTRQDVQNHHLDRKRNLPQPFSFSSSSSSSSSSSHSPSSASTVALTPGIPPLPAGEAGHDGSHTAMSDEELRGSSPPQAQGPSRKRKPASALAGVPSAAAGAGGRPDARKKAKAGWADDNEDDVYAETDHRQPREQEA